MKLYVFFADCFAAGADSPPDALEATAAIASVSVAITASKRRDILCSSLLADTARTRAAVLHSANLLRIAHPLSARVRAPAAQLVEVDGQDDRCTDDDLLPERLHVLDHEAVLEHGGYERADRAHQDAADAAEEARAAEDDRADRVQVVAAVRDRSGVRVDGEVEDRRHSCQSPCERVDLDDVEVDGDPGAPRALRVRADGARVAAEARVREDDVRHEQEGERNPDRVEEPEELAGAEALREPRRDRRGQVRASVDHLAQPESDAERAE